MDAIILAGGQGKRLRPLTDNMPKCMIPVNGKPMIQYHIDWLRTYGIKNIVVACGYKWEEIKKHYENKLIYSVEDEPLGTAGAIKKAVQNIDGEEFIVVNCDDMNNVNINELQKLGSDAICISMLPSPFGVVEVEDGYVKSFKHRPLLPHWVNIGVYILSKNLNIPDKGAIEELVFPKIKLKAFFHKGYWVTVNTVKDLEEAEKKLKEYGL